MDTIDEVDGRRRRRTHSAEFKAKVIAACRRPGVSMAAVALANKLNANMLRTWVAATERAEGQKSAPVAAQGAALQVPANVGHASFLPLHLDTTAPPPATADQINIELRRGATTIKVEWPVTAAAECSAWLKDVLR